MTVLGIIVGVIAIAIVEREQAKELAETNNNKHKFKGDKIYEEND